jgi:hypothetical protein
MRRRSDAVRKQASDDDDNEEEEEEEEEARPQGATGRSERPEHKAWWGECRSSPDSLAGGVGSGINTSGGKLTIS